MGIGFATLFSPKSFERDPFFRVKIYGPPMNYES